MRHAMLEEMEVCNPTSQVDFKLQPVSNLEDPNFFLYEQKFEEESNIGLLCSISAGNFGLIYEHEETFSYRIGALYQDLKLQKAQINPILLLTEDIAFKRKIGELKSVAAPKKNVCDQKGNIHSVWAIENREKVIALQGPMTIADGHHRYAAIQKLVEDTQFQNSVSLFAAVFYRDDVKLSRNAFIVNVVLDEHILLARLNTIAKLNEIDGFCHSSNILVCIYGIWYEMVFKKELLAKMPKDYLAIEIFSEIVLNNIFQICCHSYHPKIQMISDRVHPIESQITHKERCVFIFPQEDPANICNFSRTGRLLAPNSTFFRQKFINNIISHQIFSE